MNLHYTDTANQLAFFIGIGIPLALGILRGISPRAGWMVLHSIISGVASWCGFMHQLCLGIWTDQCRMAVEQDSAQGLGSNGAANAMGSLFGWLPGVVLFFMTFGLVCLIRKFVSSKR